MTLRAGDQILPNCTVTNVTAGILTTQYQIRMLCGKILTECTPCPMVRGRPCQDYQAEHRPADMTKERNKISS